MDYSHCRLCPRRCGANRNEGRGRCGADSHLRIARAALHFGEEPCISGTRGSGTVFFSGCPLGCVFCQNREISHGGRGEIISQDRLSEIFLELQALGAHNINLVTPSHYAPIVAAALKAVRPQLSVPVVCNCGGYESEEILAYFDGLVDVYLPDLKYYASDRSLRYSDVADYFRVAEKALKEMFRQTGPCRFSDDGMLERGLLIRHLVLPAGKEDSKKLLQWISDTFPAEEIRVSLMRQYTPCGDLSSCPELGRTLYSVEYSSVLRFAESLGLPGYQQGKGCETLKMTPAFDFTGVHRKDSL